MTKLHLQTSKTHNVTGKKVLVRVDLNVPMQNGLVTDTTRIDRIIPTLKDLVVRGARVILMAHFGRPKGQVKAEMSLAPVAKTVAEILGQPVTFATDTVGPMAQQTIENLEDGALCLLENLRFHPNEEQNDPAFAQQLAALADIYVNDAFSCAHRAHASTHAIVQFLPAYAGLSLAAECEALETVLAAPKRPMAALIGGAKVSTKLAVLENLVPKVDFLIIGGGMANTFLYALGKDIGRSLCEPSLASTAKQILATADSHNCQIILPKAVVIAKDLTAGETAKTVFLDAVPSDQMILDIGPDSAQDVIHILKKCQTLLWNGPMGAFEFPPFDAGTNAIANYAAKRTREKAIVSVAGGGDTLAALAEKAVDFSYISTAGGAFLEWLEGKPLPGIEALIAAQG